MDLNPRLYNEAALWMQLGDGTGAVLVMSGPSKCFQVSISSNTWKLAEGCGCGCQPHDACSGLRIDPPVTRGILQRCMHALESLVQVPPLAPHLDQDGEGEVLLCHLETHPDRRRTG